VLDQGWELEWVQAPGSEWVQVLDPELELVLDRGEMAVGPSASIWQCDMPAKSRLRFGLQRVKLQRQRD
jgi:hypothetical protein